jgi:hypothetical protein
VKHQLRGQRFETREAIQKAVRQCLRMAGKEFYRRGMHIGYWWESQKERDY